MPGPDRGRRNPPLGGGEKALDPAGIWAEGGGEADLREKAPLKVLNECRRVLKPGCEAWIYDPAQVCSRIDLSAWKGSLTPLERALYRIFRLYSRINPGHTYTRDEVLALVRKTEFTSWRIREQGLEIRIKLRK